MEYSERRLRIEYTLTHSIVLVLTLVAALSGGDWLRDLGLENAATLAVAFFLLSGLYAFFTMRIVFQYAKIGNGRADN